MFTGVDLSIWQHPGGAEIDYELAVSKGIDFAIIEYRDEASSVNPFFERDHAGFLRAGARVGSYCYVHPELPAAPQAEDLRMLAKYGPVWADLEITGNKNRRQLRAFWDDLRTAAPHIGLVTYPSFLESNGPLPGAPLWIDSWGAPRPPAFDGLTIWGTTDKATVPGIPATVDLDSFVGTGAQFESIFGGRPTAKGATVQSRGGIVGMASTPSGKGFWLAFRNGDVLPFGDASYHGSPHLIDLKVDAFSVTPSGMGYRLAISNGVINEYGDARPEALTPLH